MEEYKQQIAEYISPIKEKDTGTLQFDWFINDDKTECEIREAYESSEAALAHQEHLRELQAKIFKKFAPYSVTNYGNPSQELLENAKAGGFEVEVFSLMQGYESQLAIHDISLHIRDYVQQYKIVDAVAHIFQRKNFN